MKIEARPGHNPGDSQRIIDGKSICVDCDSAEATVFDDFCEPCFSKYTKNTITF